jgi:choline dehydrogenase-like flavoprotein
VEVDICVVGSGAGGGPVAWALSQKGYKVVVLEKGPWLRTEAFRKDELAAVRRNHYTPDLSEESHLLETPDNGQWRAQNTYATGRSFWNGNMVGGSSNLMSGYFHRLKPIDFRLQSEFGDIAGANIVDWPITYSELEPYYTQIEYLAGVSGAIRSHKHQEPRSTPTFPYPPLAENIVSSWIDTAAGRLGMTAIPIPRAILSTPAGTRNVCSYSHFCGSYGCATDAKSSSRVAFIETAVASGNCQVIDKANAYRIHTDASGKAEAVAYYDDRGNSHLIRAKIIVLACQAHESVRLLLLSQNSAHPGGIGNHSGQLGKNLLFSAGGSGSGDLPYAKFTDPQLATRGLFVNRCVQDWYTIDDAEMGPRMKGGLIDFLFRHANGISRAQSAKWDASGRLLWGKALKRQLETTFRSGRYLKFEVFNDWLPTDNCYVALAKETRDKWGQPIGKLRLGYHQHDLKIGHYLAKQAVRLLAEIGAENIDYTVSGSPPSNLIAGGARFGNDPATSVLDADCRVHSCENVFVSDAAFMPTGGSVTYTWTIYANSLRVGDIIARQLGKV